MASVPEKLVDEVVTRLKEWGATEVHDLAGREEHVVFTLPRELQSA